MSLAWATRLFDRRRDGSRQWCRAGARIAVEMVTTAFWVSGLNWRTVIESEALQTQHQDEPTDDEWPEPAAG